MAKKVFLLLLAFFPVRFCNAQEPIELEKIVVTPYKVAVSNYLNPSATDVILIEEPDKEGVFSLVDAIKDIPSLSYATTGSLGGETGVFIRGANSAHTQVMLDGIKLYDPIVTAAYFFGYNYISLDNLARIEVLKGPYSSLHGSDSIGGTISLITRKGKGKPELSYLQEIGSYKTAREILTAQGESNKLAYSFSVSRSDVDAFYSGRYKDGNHEKDPYHNLNSSLRLDYALSDNMDIGLLANYIYTKYEYDGWNGFDDDDNYAYFHQGVGGINLSHRSSDSFSHKATFGYTRTYRKTWESSDTNSWYNGKTYQAKWQGDYRLCDFDRVVFGFDYLRELGESHYFSFWGPSVNPRVRSNTKGYYIENIFTFWDNLFLSGAYRREDHSMFKNHDIFSASGSYTVEKTGTKIKASFGEGFKAPSLYQLFDGQYGNKNLNPEESESYDVGFEQGIGGSFRLGSTYFHTHIKNMIDMNYPDPYENLGKVRIFGLENFAELKFGEDTVLTLAYTYMDTENLSDGSRLLRRPADKVTFKLKTIFKKLDISASLSYVGNRMDSSVKLKSYILGNASVNYRVNDRLDTFLRLENILDDEYELIEGYQTPEFSWYLGAKYKF